MGRMCCSMGACSGLNHWEWCFPPTAAKQLNLCYPSFSRHMAQVKHSFKRFAVLYCEIDLKTTQQTMTSLFVPCKSQQAVQPWARTMADPVAVAQHRLTKACACSTSVSESSTQFLHMPNLAQLGSSDAISCNMARIGTKIQFSTNLEKTCFQYKI